MSIFLIWLPKVKYDIGVEILLSICTLDVKAVLGSYTKIQPAIDMENSGSIDPAKPRGRNTKLGKTVSP